MELDNLINYPYNALPWFIKDPVEALRRYVSPRKYVSLDFETNSKEHGSALNADNHIVLACWEVIRSDGSVQKRHKWGDEYAMQELERDIQEADFVVAHNAKFELQWLRRSGIDLRNVLVFDTFLAEWVISGNRGNQAGWELNLDATAKRYGLGQKVVAAKKLIDAGIDPEDIPREMLLPYCHQDVLLCRKLYKRQLKVLQESNLLHLVLTRCLCAAALADIEFAGAELDPERVKAEYDSTIREFNELERELTTFTGGINLSSPKQLSTYLFDTLKFPLPRDFKGNLLKTKHGNYKTDVKTLEKLRADTPEQTRFLQLYKKRNRLDSLITKNLLFFKLICEQKGSKFMGNINQGFTQTHRLASTGRPILFEGYKAAKGVQFQNMPRIYKSLFTAHHEDEVCLEFDAAQLEFRVAADLGHDPVATQEIVDGYDVHSYTAKVLTEAGEVTSRQDAKASTFAPLYGGGGKTPAQKEYAKAFKEKYRGIATTQKEWTMEVLDAGKLVTPYGMIFHWPGTRMSNFGYVDNTTSIYNFPIQGFATAEIIPIALVYFWHMSREHSCVVFNTIHDSICARVHKDQVDEVKMIAKYCMTTAVYQYLRDVYRYEFTVPLGAGMKVAKHWGDTPDEEIYVVWPDGREDYKRK